MKTNCRECGQELPELEQSRGVTICEPCENYEPIAWTRIKRDINGNPRYVCHWTNLITESERNILHKYNYGIDGGLFYAEAVKRANKIGGRKYHNKQYGGGIVFQSYNIKETEKSIRELVEKETK